MPSRALMLALLLTACGTAEPTTAPGAPPSIDDCLQRVQVACPVLATVRPALVYLIPAQGYSGATTQRGCLVPDTGERPPMPMAGYGFACQNSGSGQWGFACDMQPLTFDVLAVYPVFWGRLR